VTICSSNGPSNSDQPPLLQISRLPLPLWTPPLQVKLAVRDKLAHVANGKYIVVAGISPTPLGEGKRLDS
jgi:hypothetical protein